MKSAKRVWGLAFSREVFAAIDRIVTYPLAWAQIDDVFRRCLLTRFPFALIYEIHNEEIFIQVVMQLNREPDYWKSRFS